jgi:CBS-domain-containing membrane protein
MGASVPTPLEEAMKVRELMTFPVHTCRPQDSLASAAQLLWEHDCGMLPVVDQGGRVGAAITDRDICMGAYTRGRPLDELRVSDSMSREIVTCGADDEIEVAAERMAQGQLYRLPVVDADQRLCGIVSLNDLVHASEQDGKLAREALRVLRGACRHRTSVPAVVLAARGKETAAPLESAAKT